MALDFFEPAPPPSAEDQDPPAWRKVAWFIALAAGGALATMAVAYAMRSMLFLG